MLIFIAMISVTVSSFLKLRFCYIYKKNSVIFFLSFYFSLSHFDSKTPTNPYIYHTLQTVSHIYRGLLCYFILLCSINVLLLKSLSFLFYPSLLFRQTGHISFHLLKKCIMKAFVFYERSLACGRVVFVMKSVSVNGMAFL